MGIYQDKETKVTIRVGLGSQPRARVKGDSSVPRGQVIQRVSESSESQDDLTFPQEPDAAFMDREAFVLTFLVPPWHFTGTESLKTMRTDS